MNQSEQTNELIGALAKAQLEFGPVHKESENPYYASRYADLAAVIKATQPALAKYGLVVTQWPLNDAQLQEAGVISELAHSSGQWKRIELMLPAVGREKGGGSKYDAQTIGTAITYARRYSYQAIIGVAAEMDDDANSISEPSGTREAAQSVADRKIEEYKSKKGKGADSTASASAVASQDKIHAIVHLVAWKQGLVALSGAGLNIVRSEMDEDDKAFFGIKMYDKSVFCLDEKLVFKFQDLCARFNVQTKWSEPAKTVKNSTLPKAVIPPPPAFPDQPAPAKSTDPILIAAKIVEKEGKKPFMHVKWNGREHSTFDKGIWPILQAAIGKPAMFETKENGKYSNIAGIVRIDGVSFEN